MLGNFGVFRLMAIRLLLFTMGCFSRAFTSSGLTILDLSCCCLDGAGWRLCVRWLSLFTVVAMDLARAAGVADI